MRRRQVPGIVSGQGEIVLQGRAVQRHFVVREMPQQPGIVTARRQLARVLIAKRLKLRVEHEDAVVGVARVARLLVRAPALACHSCS